MEGFLQNIEPDYKFYTETYHGQMDEEDFLSSLPDAIAEVDWVVYQGENLSLYETEIKLAICAIADLIGVTEKRSTSYSAGKVSETINTSSFSYTSENTIRRYLSNTGILKRGRWL